MTFNDQIAMSAPLDTGFSGAVPGKTLLELLKISRAKDIKLVPEDNHLLVIAAKRRIKLGTYPPESFADVFKMPVMNKGKEPTDEFFESVKFCMRSVSNDASIPDQLGVTINKNDIYSTNNSTICAVHLDIPMVPERVILSAPFCQQMSNIRDKNSKIDVKIDSAIFTGKDTTLFGRLIATDKPLEFAGLLEHHLPANYKKQLVPMGTKLETILDSAIIITDSTSVERKPTKITVKDGLMQFDSISDRGEVHDKLAVEAKHPNVSVHVEAKHIKAGYDKDAKWLVTKNGVIIEKGNTIYLVGVTSG